MSEDQPALYVGHVSRGSFGDKGKTTYTVVADSRHGKIPIGLVVDYPKIRVYLTSGPEAMREPVRNTQAILRLNAAVTHYLAWAARHA